MSVGAWFAYSKFVEMRNDNEIQLKTNQQERAILQRRLDEVKKREESLKKANEAKFEKMMREQSRGLSPVTQAPISSGGQSSDEFSGMLDELKNKPSATMTPNMSVPKNLPFAFGNFTRQKYAPVQRNAHPQPFGGFKYPNQQWGNVPPAGNEPMMDREENQITDQDALTPLEEDTQR